MSDSLHFKNFGFRKPSTLFEYLQSPPEEKDIQKSNNLSNSTMSNSIPSTPPQTYSTPYINLNADENSLHLSKSD